MTEFLPIETARLRLRRLGPSDLAAFQAYRHDPVVGRYQGWSVMTDEQALSFLDEMAHCPCLILGDWFQVGIAKRETDELIGDIGFYLSEDGRSGEIGFTLCQSSQGQGLAREAVATILTALFEHTSVTRFLGITHHENTASIHLLERLGMRRLSSVEQEFRGEMATEYTYGLDRPGRD